MAASASRHDRKQKLDIEPVQAAGCSYVERILGDLLNGRDAGERQENTEMVGKILVSACDGFAARQILGLERLTVCRQDELRFRSRRCGALPQRRQRYRDVSAGACGEVNVVGLKNTADIGFVGGPSPEPLDRRLLVAESFEEGIRKVRAVKGLIRQLRNRFFYFNGVQLSASLGATAYVMRSFFRDVRAATCSLIEFLMLHNSGIALVLMPRQ